MAQAKKPAARPAKKPAAKKPAARATARPAAARSAAASASPAQSTQVAAPLSVVLQRYIDILPFPLFWILAGAVLVALLTLVVVLIQQ